MAAMHEDEVPELQECGENRDQSIAFTILVSHMPSESPAANCGAISGLLKCSRCHSAWFCGVKCQKARRRYSKLLLGC